MGWRHARNSPKIEIKEKKKEKKEEKKKKDFIKMFNISSHHSQNKIKVIWGCCFTLSKIAHHEEN